MDSTGLRRYLYEELYRVSVEEVKRRLERPLLISSARELRLEVQELLEAEGTDFDTAGITQMTNAIDAVFSEHVEGYEPLFAGEGPRSEFYTRTYNDFITMLGRTRKDADGNEMPANPGPLGPRLPISTYDPRFSHRATVRNAGVKPLFFTVAQIEREADGSPERMAEMDQGQSTLWSIDRNGEALAEEGYAIVPEDRSGLSSLSYYMSRTEYNEVADWVAMAAYNDGVIDNDRFMSAEAIARSEAILRMLRNEGFAYSIKRDRYPGQIRAVVEGTNVSIRLTDTRENENYVGRVYNDGVSIVYSPTQMNGEKYIRYEPTLDETLNLVRYGLGQPIERTDGQGLVGSAGVLPRLSGADFNAAYVTNKSQMAAVGELENQPGEYLYIMRNTKFRTEPYMAFFETAKAEEYLQAAIGSARTNLYEALDIERLIAEAERENSEDARGFEGSEWTPEFHGDNVVASIQQAYWDLLTGKTDSLLLPNADEMTLEEKVDALEDMELDESSYDAARNLLLTGVTYIGTPRSQVEQHARDVLDRAIGQYEVRTTIDPTTGEERAARFDPIGVSRYMNSDFGVWHNNLNIISAMNKLEMDVDELLGDDAYLSSVKNRMIRFDPNTARTIEDLEDGFLKDMVVYVRDAINRNAATVTSIAIDENGVISYEAVRSGARGHRDGDAREFSGQIGQIFEPGRYGSIETKYASGNNYLFVPGYNAYVVDQEPGEDLSLEERTRLIGYEQAMRRRIDYQISMDLTTSRTVVDSPTGLNAVYRSLYDTRYDVDFFEQATLAGLSEEWQEAIMRTAGARVRYPSEFIQGSTINADYEASMGRAPDLSDDNYLDPYVQSGGRNMTLLTEEGNGFFDKVMTSGGTGQGITRYLVESAEVDAEGRIIPGDPDDRVALMHMEELDYLRFDAWDRQQTTLMNIMHSRAITEPVGVAMMTLGGWTFEDGVVISKKFAEQNMVRDAQGEFRPLILGDKLADFHNNKGVIGLIVDPDMSEEEADARGIGQIVELFRDNPDLSVVQSCNSYSRNNAGTVREMMSQTNALQINGESIEGGIGRLRMIITHKTADKGTRVYTESGTGRKASSQLAWLLQAQGAEAVMRELYGANVAPFMNMREYLLLVGLDVTPDGMLREGYEPHTYDEIRKVFDLPSEDNTSPARINKVSARRDFSREISSSGGVMELPFPLKYPTGEEIEVIRQDKNGNNIYGLPVLSSHLRSGQELVDGTMSQHDYTSAYVDIHTIATEYIQAQRILADPGKYFPKAEEARKTIEGAQARAQMMYNTIVSDVEFRQFQGKRNIFRQGLMNRRIPNSATAIWTPDPTLDVDQVLMSSKMAKAMGVENDEYLMLNRDPAIDIGTLRYMRVKVEDREDMDKDGYHIAINPVTTKSFGGDFDGDTVGLIVLRGEAAKREAMERLSVQANLADVITKREDDTYDLTMHDSLDLKVAYSREPAYEEEFEDLRIQASKLRHQLDAGELTPKQYSESGKQVMKELSEHYTSTLASQFGEVVLRFDTAENYIHTLNEGVVKTGAKGSPGKLKDFCRYYGYDLEADKDLGAPQVTSEDYLSTQYAVGVKAFGTGIAGTFSQNGVKNFRNSDMLAVTSVTTPMTQAAVDSKHDAVKSRRTYSILRGTERDLWRGRELEEITDPQTGGIAWRPLREDGDIVQATPETWIKQFMEVNTSDYGLGVKLNRDHVESIAKHMVGSDGRMRDVYEDDSLQSTMDKLAYGGDFEMLHDLARENANLYDGPMNAQFAPSVIRQNAARLGEFDKAIAQGKTGYEPEVKGLAKADTLASSKRRIKSNPSLVRGVKIPRTRREPVPSASADVGMEL